jgi:hypothetical protein
MLSVVKIIQEQQRFTRGQKIAGGVVGGLGAAEGIGYAGQAYSRKAGKEALKNNEGDKLLHHGIQHERFGSIRPSEMVSGNLFSRGMRYAKDTGIIPKEDINSAVQ